MHYISKIKLELSNRKITIEKMAKDIGYSRIGLTNALNSGDLKVSTLQSIADFLKVPITYFFDDTKATDIDRVVNALSEVIKEAITKKIK